MFEWIMWIFLPMLGWYLYWAKVCDIEDTSGLF